MLKRVLLIRFVYASLIACNRMSQNVVCGFCSVVLCTVSEPLINVFCVAAFPNVFDDSFYSVSVVSGVLFVLTLLLRW